MEAMAAGLPVVATAVGGVPEIVGDAGTLVPSGDESGLRTALESVLGNRERYAAAALRRAAAFDVRHTIEAYSGLFENVVR
jgi:glycosyltransferase involved in cell wall biosynthesis